MNRFTHKGFNTPLAVICVFSLLISLPLVMETTLAADRPIEFEDPQREKRYKALLEEIRCLVCQNQSLADSNASLAQDLRDEVYQQIQSGKNDDQIIDFLVSRYGEFVLYRPPFNDRTWLLWLGPFILLLAATVVVFRIVRRRRATLSSKHILDPDDRERIEKLLNENEDEAK